MLLLLALIIHGSRCSFILVALPEIQGVWHAGGRSVPTALTSKYSTVTGFTVQTEMIVRPIPESLVGCMLVFRQVICSLDSLHMPSSRFPSSSSGTHCKVGRKVGGHNSGAVRYCSF